MNKHLISATAFAALLTCMSCNNNKELIEKNPLQQKVEEFASFELTADISHLSANEKELLGIFLWRQIFDRHHF